MTSIPSLSESGWISSPAEKVDKLLSYFVTSEYSQSNLYSGKIASFPYLIANYASDQYRLQAEIRETLESFLDRYFDSVDVDVKVEDNPKNDSKLSIKLILVVTDDNVRYSAGREIQTLNSQFVKIGKINNG